MDKNTNCDIVFLILHYMVYDETIKAISYIEKNIDTSNYRIIIVDNASTNNSYEILKERYVNNKNIVLIRNEENLGFSKGNNIGFKYAKEYFHPKYIVMMNNDVYLLEKQLFTKLEEEYNSKVFAVAGPLVIQRNGTINENPRRKRLYTMEEIDYKIKRKTMDCFFLKIHMYEFLQFCRRLKSRIYRTLHIKNKQEQYFKGLNVENGELPAYLCKVENVELYGCCLIFSELYLSKWDGLDPRTFMYYEEEILYAHMMWGGARTVYLPEIAVFHNEGAATKAVLNKDRYYRFNNDRIGFIALKELYQEHYNGKGK